MWVNLLHWLVILIVDAGAAGDTSLGPFLQLRQTHTKHSTTTTRETQNLKEEVTKKDTFKFFSATCASLVRFLSIIMIQYFIVNNKTVLL